MLERRIEKRALLIALGLCVAGAGLAYTYSHKAVIKFIFAGFGIGAVNLHIMIRSVEGMRAKGAKSVVGSFFLRYGMIAATVILAALGGVSCIVATVGGIASVYTALFAVGMSGWS